MATVTDSLSAVEAWSWQEAVRQTSTIAHARLPSTLHGDVERATSLVLQGAVFFEEDGSTCQVRSGKDATQFYPVNGHCGCERAKQAPKGLCKHRLAAMLYLRAEEVFRADPPQPEQALRPEDGTGDDAPQAHITKDIPKEYLQLMHGKPFIRYFGLLAMAHAQGLTSVEATYISVTDALAVAQAVVLFQDGRRFVECGDATPDNVHVGIRPHFARLALTRAKARALRDALNIGICSVEELE